MNFSLTKVALLTSLLAGSAFADFEVQGALGTLDDAAVQRTVAGGAEAFQACFRERAGLAYVGGAVSLRVRVARDGKVRTAQVAESDLGSWPVEKCLLGLARGLTFDKPTGGEAEVTIPIVMRGAHDVATVDADRAAGEIAAQARTLSSCGKVGGDVDVTTYVGVGGAVMSVGFAGDVTDKWAECAVKKAKDWRLTDPRGRVVKMKGRLLKAPVVR